MFLFLAGCGDDGSAPSASTALPPLAPELVGTWTTSSTSGSQQIARTYVFSSDGRYEYTIGMCQSSSDCSLVSQESGYAQATNGVLSLEPQTEPNDGDRSLPYVVAQDPNVGDIQLHFTLPDGQVDIFYLG